MSNDSAGPVVLARDVHKTYGFGEVEVHVLRGVSLDVRRGEMVAIMGPAAAARPPCSTASPAWTTSIPAPSPSPGPTSAA